MTTTKTPHHVRLLTAVTLVPLLRWAIAAHSVPPNQPWRTACPCGQPLWTSATGLSGRCTGCGQRLGAPPYTVETATALCVIALMLSGRTGWALAAYAWWAAGMIVLAFVDVAVGRLPHRITALTTTGFLSLLAAAGDPSAWTRAAAAGLVLAGIFTILAIASHGQLGWGDVTLAVPVAAALGWHSVTAVYTGTLLGLGAAAATATTLRLLGRLPARAHLPLGPFLITAAAVVLLRP